MNGLTEKDIYHTEIMNILEGKNMVGSGIGSSSGGGWDDEALIQQAIEVISKTRKASATMLQRKLNIGFARAARIMDALEEKGVIWPQDGAKPRDIYI